MQQMQTYLSNSSTCFDFSSKINALERLSNESTSLNSGQDLQRTCQQPGRPTELPDMQCFAMPGFSLCVKANYSVQRIQHSTSTFIRQQEAEIFVTNSSLLPSAGEKFRTLNNGKHNPFLLTPITHGFYITARQCNITCAVILLREKQAD